MEIEDGFEVQFEEYTPKNRPMYRRWKARCSHHGKKCSKFRAISKPMCKLHGDVEPVSYFSCWHDMGVHLSFDNHKGQSLKIDEDMLMIKASLLRQPFEDRLRCYLPD